MLALPGSAQLNATRPTPTVAVNVPGAAGSTGTHCASTTAVPSHTTTTSPPLSISACVRVTAAGEAPAASCRHSEAPTGVVRSVNWRRHAWTERPVHEANPDTPSDCEPVCADSEEGETA